MQTLTSTVTKTVSGTKMVIAVFALFGAGAVALATLPLQLNRSRVISPTVVNNVNANILHADGCYLVLDGKEKLIDSSSNQYCKNIFLANYFSDIGDKNDFYYLLNSKGKGSLVNKNDLSAAKVVEVIYYSGGVADNFKAYLVSKINTGKCEEMAYWDNVLKCFNEADLKKVVQYITFLKYTAPDVFQIAKDWGVYFEDSNCEQGAKTGPSGKVELCRSLFADSTTKVHAAGVIYHEIYHFISHGHFYLRKEGNNCVQNPDLEGSGGDADWNVEKNKNKDSGYSISVYGAHMKYLLAVLNNSDCKDRWGAYNDLNFNLNKLGVLCVKPDWLINKPTCSL